MWKTQLNKAVKELRFVLKQTPNHNGVWRFVEVKLPELRMLNQNTFFSIAEINEEFKTDSACHFVYGDVNNTQEMVESAGLTAAQFEKILIEKVKYGLTLERHRAENDDEREIPVDIVQSHNYVRHLHDTF